MRTGFESLGSREMDISYSGSKTDIDQIFIFNNVIVVIEETCSADSDKIRDHLNKKILFLQNISKDVVGFVRALGGVYPDLAARIKNGLEPSAVILRYVYCTRYAFDKEDRSEYRDITFLRHEYLKHFLALTRAIGKSARFEVYKFLRLRLIDISYSPAGSFDFDGFILPSTRSGFGEDVRVVTFYAQPEALIELGYALRRDSWMDSDGLYQRMLSPTKLRKMRAYLSREGHVYVNNIIVGLPCDTTIENSDGKRVGIDAGINAQAVRIKLRNEFNSVGIIDGQHRVFSYHEGTDIHERIIATKRNKQQLLVTGLLFTGELSEVDRVKREAQIFLDINAEQTSAKAELKQAIATIVSPFTSIAIAKSIISSMAVRGPLEGLLHDHFYDEGRIKTASIISYGLRFIVDIEKGPTSSTLLAIWDRRKAEVLWKARDPRLRSEYVKFCADHINSVISGFYANVPRAEKDFENKNSRGYSVTMLNGLLYCIRLLLQAGRLHGNTERYVRQFKDHNLKLLKGAFKYKSSQWKSLGELLARQCFEL